MNKIEMFYLRSKTGFPVACVASTTLPGNMVRYAISTHNPVDRYDKKTAREIAMDRLIQPVGFQYDCPGVHGGFVSRDNYASRDNTAHRNIVEDIIAGPFPQRARDAARHMLKTRFYSE